MPASVKPNQMIEIYAQNSHASRRGKIAFYENTKVSLKKHQNGISLPKWFDSLKELLFPVVYTQKITFDRTLIFGDKLSEDIF